MSFARQFNKAISNNKELGYLGHMVWPVFDTNDAPELGSIVRIGRSAILEVETQNAFEKYNVSMSVKTMNPLPTKRISYGASYKVAASQEAEVPVAEGLTVGMKRSIKFGAEYAFVLESNGFFVRRISDLEDRADKLFKAMKKKGNKPDTLDYLVYEVVEVDDAYFVGSSKKGVSVELASSLEVENVGKVSNTLAFDWSSTRGEERIYPPAGSRARVKRAAVAVKLLRWKRGGNFEYPKRS